MAGLARPSARAIDGQRSGNLGAVDSRGTVRDEDIWFQIGSSPELPMKPSPRGFV